MAGCSKCDNGYITIEPLGLRVKCSCTIDNPNNKQEVEKNPEKPYYHVTGAQKEMAVYKGLIPEGRKEDEFDEEFFRDRIVTMCKVQNCRVVDFQKYIDTLNEILIGISTNTLRRSYIVGAPSGFGKTTFVYTCIKRLYAMGKKAVPYLSLFELASLRDEHERKLMGSIFGNKKKAEQHEDEHEGKEDTVKYIWQDFMQADVLFTYMSGLDNMRIESKILKIIMEIRGPKELPTVVMTANSLKPYFANIELKQYIWDDILAYSDDLAGCDRLIHRSCFKVYNTKIKAVEGEDF